MKKTVIIIMIGIIIFSIIGCQRKPKKVLYVFNWTDYIAPELIRKFEKQNDCRIIYDTYNSNENMLTKMMTSKSAYDIIVPSGDHISILIQQDLIDKIDKNKLTNYHNLDPMILKKSLDFDNKNEYSIPYFWGTCGIIFNKKYINEEDMKNISWGIIGDDKFSDKRVITMLDDAREVIGVALIHNGFNPNDFSFIALEAARKTLLEWDKNIAQFDSDSFKNEVQDGTIWLGQAYNGDAMQVLEENDNIGFVLPKEGSTLWVDYLAIPKNAENKELAHKFINFLLEEQIAAINAEFVQYATPNKAAFKLLPQELQDNTNIYPSDEYLEKCFLLKNVGNDILKVDSVWQEIRHN